MNALLIDDEPRPHIVLKELLKHYHPNINILDSAYSVAEGKQKIQQYQPDLLFLDIEMSDGTGFDLLQQVDYTKFGVIFVTGYNEYAQTAIRFGALDYIIKPIKTKDLQEAVFRAEMKHLRRIQSDQLDILQEVLESLAKKKQPKRMSIATDQGVLFFKVDDVIHVKAMGNYTQFFVQNDDRTLLASKNIGAFVDSFEQLPDFMRIQRSHIINLRKVIRLIKTTQRWSVEMENHNILPVSKTKQEELEERLGDL